MTAPRHWKSLVVAGGVKRLRGSRAPGSLDEPCQPKCTSAPDGCRAPIQTRLRGYGHFGFGGFGGFGFLSEPALANAGAAFMVAMAGAMYAAFLTNSRRDFL